MFSDGQMYEFHMEMALIRACIPCRDCVSYFDSRHTVLMPEILKVAERLAEDPADVLTRFRNRLHKTHS